MNKFYLKTKSGEKINFTFANTLYDAQVKFSKIKSLDIKALLEIFIIEEEVFSYY
jgi:hypothetical protein